MNEIVSFYNNLKTSNNITEKEVYEYLNNINLPNILGESDKKLSDEELTITEIENAILVIKNNRSPGSDGLSPEFYKHFMDEFKHLYYNMLKETFQYGQMPESKTIPIITLIFKKGESEMPKNYTPINLTNYDYKILAYLLAKRKKL